VRFAEHDNVVERFATYFSYEALDVAVRPERIKDETRPTLS
jgi:hypothetical protein